MMHIVFRPSGFGKQGAALHKRENTLIFSKGIPFSEIKAENDARMRLNF
jgi:hypothetical protein